MQGLKSLPPPPPRESGLGICWEGSKLPSQAWPTTKLPLLLSAALESGTLIWLLSDTLQFWIF